MSAGIAREFVYLDSSVACPVSVRMSNHQIISVASGITTTIIEVS